MESRPSLRHRHRASMASRPLAALRWLFRLFSGSAPGSASLEQVIAIGLCALAGLLAFKHFGTALNADLRLQAERITGPGLPSANDFDLSPGDIISGLGGDRDPGGPELCRIDGSCGVPGQCFAAGTLVSTAEGLRGIETIRRGDRVWAQDVETGALELKPVTATFVRPDTAIIDVELRSGAYPSERLSVTPGHRFWIEGSGWTQAASLATAPVGSLADPLSASALSTRGEVTTVYNLEVEDFHDYFVGQAGALVHNGDDDDEGDGPDPDDCNSPRDNPVEPDCFDRPSTKRGLDGFEPRRVYDPGEVKNDPRFIRKQDDRGRDYWEPNDKLKREMMRQEEDRQLAAQQRELNGMTIDELLKNRRDWRARLAAAKAAGDKRPTGRPADDAATRRAERRMVMDALIEHYLREQGTTLQSATRPQKRDARAAATRDIDGTSALHKLDGIAGGDGTMHGLGNGVINGELGNQWPRRADATERWAEKQESQGHGSQRMNVVLSFCD